MPKVYVVLGLTGLYFFLIVFNIGGQFLVNTAGFVLPAYYSLNALFSAEKIDDTQVRPRILKQANPSKRACPNPSSPPMRRRALTSLAVVDGMIATHLLACIDKHENVHVTDLSSSSTGSFMPS